MATDLRIPTVPLFTRERVLDVQWIKFFRDLVSSGGASGTPGGSNHQVQYNNSGAFGGIANSVDTTYVLTSNGLLSTPSFQALPSVFDDLAPSVSYTIPAHHSQVLAGTLTLAAGVTVTVGLGATLRIL